MTIFQVRITEAPGKPLIAPAAETRGPPLREGQEAEQDGVVPGK